MSNFWEKLDWEKEDHHLSALNKMPFQREFPKIELKTGVYAIRGPRQVGKSSWMKTLLSEQVKKGKSCFFVSCENFEDFKDLSLFLDSVKEREVIFLDEISFVKDWSRSIKHKVDSGSKQTFVITGSNASDIRKGIDLMPGRWGAGGEFFLLPMLFDEYLKMRAMAGWAVEDRLSCLEKFFISGGFPSAVAESGDAGKIPLNSMKNYWLWLKGDVIKQGRQEVYLTETLIQLAKTLCTPISLQSLAQKTQMGSHHTAMQYVTTLEDSFALRTLYAVDLNEGSYRFRKDKKFYFSDPLIYHMAMNVKGKLKTKSQDFEKISEMVAHEYLFRSYKRFGYFSSKNGEVDFVLPHEWAIEVKWVDAVTHVSAAFKNLKIVDKKVWSKSNFLNSY